MAALIGDYSISVKSHACQKRRKKRIKMNVVEADHKKTIQYHSTLKKVEKMYIYTVS